MRILRYTLFLFAIGLISCEQEFDKKNSNLIAVLFKIYLSIPNKW